MLQQLSIRLPNSFTALGLGGNGFVNYAKYDALLQRMRNPDARKGMSPVYEYHARVVIAGMGDTDQTTTAIQSGIAITKKYAPVPERIIDFHAP